MRTRMYGGVRGRKTKVGRKLSFSSYSINVNHSGVARSEDSSYTAVASLTAYATFDRFRVKV